MTRHTIGPMLDVLGKREGRFSRAAIMHKGWARSRTWRHEEKEGRGARVFDRRVNRTRERPSNWRPSTRWDAGRPPGHQRAGKTFASASRKSPERTAATIFGRVAHGAQTVG